MRDFGLLYEAVLRREGIKTKVDVYPGLPHGFWSVYAGEEKGEGKKELEFMRRWRTDVGLAWKWLLAQD